MMNQEDLFKNIISHCKEYGFVFQSSEIYDGLSAVYDYGQMGAELKKNLRDFWWKSMVQMNQNQVKLETSGIGTSLEQKVVGFFHKEVFEEPNQFYVEFETNKETSLGLITSGGTLSNITALQLALSKALNELFWFRFH